MDIQKVRITSSEGGFGLRPSPKVEVEQHLTISANGRVWFTGYNNTYASDFGPDNTDNYVVGRRHQFFIGKKKAFDILSLISQYCDNQPFAIFATDIGLWEMTITDTNKGNHKFKGSLCGGVSVGTIDLTDYIRKHIPIDSLFVFDMLRGDDD